METELKRQEYQLTQQTSRGGGSLVIGVLVSLLLLGIAGTMLILPPLSELTFTRYLAVAIAIIVLAIAVKGARIVAYRRRVTRLSRRFPHAPWWQDYPWDPSGIDAALDKRLRSGIFHVVIVGAILVPIHYALVRDAGAIVFIALGTLDLLFFMLVLRLANHYQAYRRYGRVRVVFSRFPFAPGENMALKVILPSPLPILATLRFIHEKYWNPPHPREPPRPAAYEHYSKTIGANSHSGALEVPLQFELPNNLEWVTHLTAPNVQYWELHLETTHPGVNLDINFPLPVYAGADRARSNVAPNI